MAEKSWPHSSGHHKLSGLYELKKTLGRGHFAVVRLAQHVFTGEKVAIKVIDKTKLDKTSMDHLYHEVTCMKLVQHPNVVRLYEVIETSTKLYLILELGDGGDMYDYIMKHDQGLDEEQAKEYFAQILCAISYCHKMHVVHRDLKPENIVFFESQGLVKLTDFGFSNQYDPGKKLSTSCGSLAYSAPEILLGEEYDAQAVDVWSLGVILYMLVCGEAPFNEANDSETLTNIMDCNYTVLDHVDRDCSDLIKRMIIREPDERLDLEDIRNHPWLKDCATLRDDVFNCTPVLTRDLISDDLHSIIVKRMADGKLAEQDEIEEAIDENKYNHITSTYYLLAHRSLEARRKPSDSGLLDEEMEATSSGELINKMMIPNTNNLRLHQLPAEHLPMAAKASIPYSSSPPMQATIVPVSQTGLHGPSLLTHVEEVNEDSSPASSNSSLYHSGYASLLKGDRKMSPPFPREHLTITPRHGFSVAKGGINTLIEEEERSRSQTTTDDEDDGIMSSQAEEDITCARIINPVQLASQLQRASLQMKRLKKRKSAPVLNEICEENENEPGDSSHRPDIFRKEREAKFNQGRKHTMSLCSTNRQGESAPLDIGEVDMVDAEVFQSGKVTPMEDTLSELHMDVISCFASRKGQGRRKGSLKSSGSETSDEDSESRRASRSSLHATVCNFNRSRRDSSGDRDPSNGSGGHHERTNYENGGSTGLGSSHLDESSKTQNDANQNSRDTGSMQDGASETDNNNFNNSVHQVLLPGKAAIQCVTNTTSLSYTDQIDTLNNSRGRHLSVHLPVPCNQICNILEKRSRSAESSQSLRSTCSSSQTSSARSSSSSLGFRRGRILNSCRVKKNSRSTMSDTGLVLRLNNLRNTGIPVSLSSSSVTSLSISFPKAGQSSNPDSLHRPHSEGNVMEEDFQSSCKRTARHQYRSTSLPRPSYYLYNNLNNPRAASCGPHPTHTTRKRQCSSSHTSLIVTIQPCIPESHFTGGIDTGTVNETKESNIKRSNISLASSTCSASKYAVDPVNEMVLSPMEEEVSQNGTVSKHGSNVKLFRRLKKSSTSNSSDSLRCSKYIEKNDPPTPTKVERIKMTFFSHLVGDGIFRRRGGSKSSISSGRQWFEHGNIKMKPLPDASVYGMFNRDTLPSDSPLLMRKTRPDCCVIM